MLDVTRLLSIVSLVLVLVLFPPAALALVSNNAVPGDPTYPIKRGLEEVIYKVVSLNPTTKAWFAAARSDRRFKEFSMLVTQGKKTGEVLNELVRQTEIAADQIASVRNEGQKEKLVQKLSESIKKYDQGLKQLSTETTAPTATIVPSARLIPVPTQRTVVGLQPTVSPTTVPTVQPDPTLTAASSPSPTPTSQSTPTPTPASPNQDEQERQRQIEETRRRLEEIGRELREEQEQQRRRHQQEINLQPEEVIPGQILPHPNEDKIQKKNESNEKSRQEKKQSDNKKEAKDRNLDQVVARDSTSSSATSSEASGSPKQ